LHTSLGYEVKTFIRTEAEVAGIASYEPFPKAEVQRAGSYNVGFLAAPLQASAKRILMALKTEIDVSMYTAARCTGCARRNRATRLLQTPSSRRR
jgi:uncharacterized protein (DUF1697 family)